MLAPAPLEPPPGAPAGRSGRQRRAAGNPPSASGLILGFLALIRAEGVLIAVLLVGTGLLGALARPIAAGVSSPGPWWRWAGCWPWRPGRSRNAVRLSAMNERLAGRLAEPLPTFVPLTIYGPVNLALANNPQADGTFSREFLASQAQSGGAGRHRPAAPGVHPPRRPDRPAVDPRASRGLRAGSCCASGSSSSPPGSSAGRSGTGPAA